MLRREVSQGEGEAATTDQQTTTTTTRTTIATTSYVMFASPYLLLALLIKVPVTSYPHHHLLLLKIFLITMDALPDLESSKSLANHLEIEEAKIFKERQGKELL